MEIEGCVAVVTGGASGLGEGCVRDLVKKGAKVAIFDIQEDRAGKITSELGSSAIFCRSDVADEKAVQFSVDKTIDSFGTIHIVINCAGVPSGEKVVSSKGLISMERFNKVVQLNLMGTMNVIRSSVEKMVKNKPNEEGEKGVIINTASIAAFDGQIGQTAYSASKAAIVGLTLPLARELAEHGIRVVTIAPGIFLTALAERVPEKVRESNIKEAPFPKRLGKPSEFAQLAREIIENPMLNGETIRLDGAIRLSGR